MHLSDNYKMTSIFISHHSSKSETAMHLAEYLERIGLKCWIAPRDIVPGCDWDQAISEAIKKCDSLVLLFCGSADQSKHVKREVMLAEKNSKIVYPIRLENIAPDRLGYFLETSQWIDWLDQRDETLDGLVRALKSRQIPRETFSNSNVPKDTSLAPFDRVKACSWPRKIISCLTDSLAHETTARLIFSSCKLSSGDSVILPTGKTGGMLFKGMLSCCEDYSVDPFYDSPIFSDTETYGVHSNHSTSRSKFVRTMLFDRLKKVGKVVPDENINLLSGLILDENPYQRILDLLRYHPPSVHAISIAPSGEVIGYEVGTYTDAEALAADRCRVIEVSEMGKRYIDPGQPSRSIVSIGMVVPVEAKTLLIPIFDIKKVPILRKLLLLPEDPATPASILKRNSNSFIISTQRILEEANVYPDLEISNSSEIINFIKGELT